MSCEKFNTLPDYNLSRPLQKPRYKVYYFINNDKANGIEFFPTDTNTYAPGDVVVVQDAPKKFYSEDGVYVYRFEGWSTLENVFEVNYEANDILNITNRDVKLYAIWSKELTLEVDFIEGAIVEILDEHKYIPYLRIPEYIEGIRITKIKHNAFYETYIQEIVISPSISYIGDFAFKRWKGTTLRFIDSEVTEKYPALTIGLTFLYESSNIRTLVLPYRWRYFGDIRLIDTTGTETLQVYIRNRKSLMEELNPEVAERYEDGFDSAIMETIDDRYTVTWEYNE